VCCDHNHTQYNIYTSHHTPYTYPRNKTLGPRWLTAFAPSLAAASAPPPTWSWTQTGPGHTRSPLTRLFPPTLDVSLSPSFQVGTYTNCFSANAWDKTLCSDPASCAKNCALDAGSISDYESTYGVSSTGTSLELDFVTTQRFRALATTNVGSRNYLFDASSEKYTPPSLSPSPTAMYYNATLGSCRYVMFKLLNKEFTFDVDVSTLPCGLNGEQHCIRE